MSRLVLTDASLIDAVTPGVTAGASVTVEDDRIVEILDGLSPDLVKRAEDAVDEHRAWFASRDGGRPPDGARLGHAPRP